MWLRRFVLWLTFPSVVCLMLCGGGTPPPPSSARLDPPAQTSLRRAGNGQSALELFKWRWGASSAPAAAAAAAAASGGEVSAQADGPKYFVSPTGSDTNKGNETSPWRHIQYAIGRARPGDTIYVRGGTYREALSFPASGAEGAPITISGYGDEKVLLDGTGLNVNAVDFGSSSYITIEKLTVKNWPNRFAFVGWGNTDHITLRDLLITDVGGPIKIGAAGGKEVRAHLTFERITAANYTGPGMTGIDIGPGYSSDIIIRQVSLKGEVGGNETARDGIAIENGQNVLVEDVTVLGHPGDGVDLKADNATVRRVTVRDHGRNGIKVWGTNGVVESCWVSGSQTGLGALILAGNGPYTVRNNVLINGGGAAGSMNSHSIEIGPYETKPNSAPIPVTLSGNTFHAEGNSGILIRFSETVRIQPGSDNNTFYSPRQDTLFYGAHNAAGASMPLVTPADINGGAWARFIRGGKNNRFSPKVPASPPQTAASAPAALDLALPGAPVGQRPRRVNAVSQ